MPRELTLQSVRQEAAGKIFEVSVRQKDRTVWVSLSGILDKAGVELVKARVSTRLLRRGYRIVLHGGRLTHLDYRATSLLVQWNRSLSSFGHQLYLQDWNDYLKAILCMEDWDRELGATPQKASIVRTHQEPQVSQMP